MSKKYLAQSRAAQQRRKRYNACDRKKAFPTHEAALRKGQDVYHCRFCRQYHRTGSLAQLANNLTKRHARRRS